MTATAEQRRAAWLERNRRKTPLTPEQEETIGRIVAGVRREKRAAS